MNQSAFPNLRQSILLIIFFFLFAFIYFLITGLVPQLFGIQLPELYVTIVFAISPVAYLPLIIYINKKTGVQLIQHVKVPDIQIMIFLILLAISAKIITSPLINPMEYLININDNRLKLFVFSNNEINLNFVIKLLGSILIIPIFEEIFFRKQIFGLLLRKYSPVVSVVLSSVLFAIMHLRFNEAGSLFIWGILYSIVYYQTNSIEASVILHSMCNLSTFIFGTHYLEFTQVHLFRCSLVFLISVVIMLLVIKYLNRYGNRRRQLEAEKTVENGLI